MLQFHVQFMIYIILILSPMLLASIGNVYKKAGPRGMPLNKTTDCATFGKNARFNPHSILGDTWFVFYYWAMLRPTMIYKFRVPSKRDLGYLHYLLDGHVRKDFDWKATMLLIEDLTDNNTSLLVERGDRGQYWVYMLFTGLPLGQYAIRYETQWKQTGDNKYIGAMTCKSNTAFVMSRVHEVPSKKMLQEEASKLGYIGRRGKSYLDQGQEWMPIPDAEEKDFWKEHSHYLGTKF